MGVLSLRCFAFPAVWSTESTHAQVLQGLVYFHVWFLDLIAPDIFSSSTELIPTDRPRACLGGSLGAPEICAEAITSKDAAGPTWSYLGVLEPVDLGMEVDGDGVPNA